MQANDYLYTYGVKNQQYDYIPMSPYDGNIPPDAPQLSPSQSQHPGGYSSHHQYHPTPFDGTPGYGYFSPNAPMQPPPAAPGQLQSFHAHQPSDPTVYSMNQNFQFPQEPMRRGKSASGSSPKKSMKHMTCWYWHKYRECKYEEPQCLYAHSYAGTIRVADEPIQREPGSKSLSKICLCSIVY